jgi:valyl-tRNA synthetase
MYSDQTVSANAAKKNAALAVLYTCLHTALRLTHPTMPFLSEELWHRLPGAVTRSAPTTDRESCGSIAVASYPKPVRFSASGLNLLFLAFFLISSFVSCDLTCVM